MEGARLRQAREYRSMTQSELADRMGVSQPAIAQLELGTRSVGAEVISRLSDSLGLPEGFLERPARELADGSLGLTRSLRSLPQSEFRSARRRAELALEAISGLTTGTLLPSCSIPSLRGASAADAAAFVRSSLGVSSDEPIRNLTRSLERAGVLVASLRWNDSRAETKAGSQPRLDGFASWVGMRGHRPFLVVNRRSDIFRRRLSLAHELGHAVLGHFAESVSLKELEEEAYAFAGAFMVPPALLEECFRAMRPMSAAQAISSQFGVSIKAAIKMASDSCLITPSQAKYAYQHLHGASSAPNVGEAPLLARRAANLTWSDPINVNAVACDLALPTEVVAEVLFDDTELSLFTMLNGGGPHHPS